MPQSFMFTKRNEKKKTVEYYLFGAECKPVLKLTRAQTGAGRIKPRDALNEKLPVMACSRL